MAIGRPVTIPDAAVGGSDLQAPLKALLNSLNMLEEDKSKGGTWLSTPSQAAAVIESGATSLAKWWAVVVGAVGGTTVIATAATKFWSGQHGSARVAVLAAVGAVLVAAVLSVAIIVSADIRSRAQGMSAVYAARAQIAQEFMAISYNASQSHVVDSGDLEAVVSKATQDAVAEGVAPLSSSLSNIESQVSGLERRSAVVATAAVKQAMPNGPSVVVRTSSGNAGFLQGIEIGPNGTDGVMLRVRAKDGKGPADHLKVGDVTELRSRKKKKE